jgi:RNA polymerase sigma-70 factor (ECF subfamily)
MKDEVEILNAALLQQLMAGEERALKDIIYRYRNQLFSNAYYLLGDADQSNDAIQEVFIKLWDVRTRLNKTTSLEKYLVILTRNHCISILRKNKTRQRRAEKFCYSQPHYSYVDGLENAELGSRLNAALQSLTASQKKIFHSVYFEGKSHLEVMQEQNIKLPTVKVTIYSALKVLRAKLHDIVK